MSLGPIATGETQRKLASIIEASFDTRPMPLGNITIGEVKRRTELAKDIFTTLWRECGWSQQRILDHLSNFLVRGLDGEEPIPDWAKEKVGENKSVMWGKEAAGRVERESRLTALKDRKVQFKEHRAGENGPLIYIPKGG